MHTATHHESIDLLSKITGASRTRAQWCPTRRGWGLEMDMLGSAKCHIKRIKDDQDMNTKKSMVKKIMDVKYKEEQSQDGLVAICGG